MFLLANAVLIALLFAYPQIALWYAHRQASAFDR